MSQFYATLLKTLQNDPRFFSKEGDLLRNAVYTAALQMDTTLIKNLLTNEETRKHFFTNIDGVHVFDKVGFGWVINNRQFLPDSYTRYKNKIGLVNPKGDFISQTQDVEIVFPYKDCVLEGGQTKDDQKRNEIFYNETLSPDEVDRLLHPKVFTNASRYTKDGSTAVTQCSQTDNIIIKGNNLLALSSLLPRYAGKIKCIYIDPPYNTGNDSFKYNDSFNHSTWLVFMKNRLIFARELLSSYGCIFITCDDNEQAYLKILCDEIFDKKNFIANFIWKHRKSSQNDIDVSLSHNYNLAYAKKRELFKLNSLEVNIAKFSNPDNDPRGNWVADPMDAPGVRTNLSYKIENPNTHEIYLPPDGRHWRFTQDKFEDAKNDNRIIFGKIGKSKPQYKRFQSEAEEKGENTFSIWDDISTATDGTREIIKLFGSKEFPTPKPEMLLKRIIELSTKENDIVLDFFAGSGTTLAVAHKMNRQYIGIEQMNYIHELPEARLKKVIEGEQGGISKEVNWQGGGSFVYCELKELNQSYADRIQSATTHEQLVTLWNDICNTGFISTKVTPKEIDTTATDFASLALADKQKLLMDLLDKNMLYVNYCDIDDSENAVTQADKDFTNSFYKGE